MFGSSRLVLMELLMESYKDVLVGRQPGSGAKFLSPIELYRK